MMTRKRIASGFRALGLPEGVPVLVHSSLRSFGRVDGGAETVIDGLLDAVGPRGTVMAATLTGHRGLSPANPPVTDMRTAPAWNGRIPETLRQRSDAVRSIHPTHSCAAVGAQAEALTHGHENTATPCGVPSPYWRNAAAGGYIAMAGCILTTCTTMHTIEELANVPYHLQPKPTRGVCIDARGRRVQVPVRLHDYGGPERDFPVMEPILLKRGLMRIGKVGKSTVRLIQAMGLIESALECLRSDPYFLTEARGTRR
jgi:aminoglycoside 3-N-acetyltransferase